MISSGDNLLFYGPNPFNTAKRTTVTTPYQKPVFVSKKMTWMQARTRPTYFPPRTTTKSRSTTAEVPMTIKIEGIPKKSCCTKEGFKLDWADAIRPLG